MAQSAQTSFTNSDIQQLIGIKTNIGGYFFDAVLKTSHQSKLKITEHPVEEGAAITDHSYVEPQSVTIEVGMSDVCASIIDGQFDEGGSRSITAFNVLKKLQSARIPMTVQTRLQAYNNMLIETITVSDDFTTMYGLKATVSLREIIVVRTKTVALSDRASSDPNKTGETNRGTVQAEPINDSIIYQIASPFMRE